MLHICEIRSILNRNKLSTICYIFTMCTYVYNGPGISVCVVTVYWLDGPQIEFLWGEIFRTWPDRHRGPPNLLYNGYRVFARGNMRPENDAGPSPRSSAEVKNSVEL